MELNTLSKINQISFSKNNQNDINIFWLEASGDGIKSRVMTPLMHKHSFFEIHIVLEGEVKCLLEETQLTLNKEDFILLAPNTMHQIVPSENGFLRISITFLTKAGSQIDKMLSSQSYITGRVDDNVKKAIKFILENAANSGHYTETLCANRIFEIVYFIAQGNHLSAPVNHSPRPVNDYLDKAKKYIQDNSHIFLNCEEVAAYCHISTKQLGRIFERFEKMSLHKYINSTKLKDAQNLIENTDLPFSKISSMLGFNTDNYFNAFFRKSTGMTPGQYRRRFGK